MIRVLRIASLCLLLTSGAVAQTGSSLGGGGALPPPVPRQGAEPARPAAPPAAAPRPPAPAPATRPAATPPGAQTRPAAPQATPPRPTTAPARPATTRPAPPPTRPNQALRPRPPAPPPAAAAAGVAAGAAGAAAAAPAPAPPEPPAPSTGQVTGLPLPRFAALRSNEVNLRAGPDTRFPVEWTYQRRDLPVMIVGEHQLWRRVRDMDGVEGWVHQATLAGRRTFLVQGEARTVRARPDDAAPAVAVLRPGVVGRIRSCEAAAEWCEVQVAEHRGWLRRAGLWGLAPDEAVD
jgi:SH3-like domain-containing protein